MAQKRTKSTTKRTAITRADLGWRAKFLEVLGNQGNVTEACDLAGVAKTTVYKHARLDPEFKQAWRHALGRAADSLEQEAWRRAKQGSDTLLIFLLKGLRPRKFREHARVEQVQRGTIRHAHEFDLSELTDDELERFEQAFSRRTGGTGEAGRV